MITYDVVKPFPNGKFYREGSCLSTDTKPTSDETMMNGSKLLEMDTATLYIYDDANNEWKAWA